MLARKFLNLSKPDNRHSVGCPVYEYAGSANFSIKHLGSFQTTVQIHHTWVCFIENYSRRNNEISIEAETTVGMPVSLALSQ